jgi:hypothetical protein
MAPDEGNIHAGVGGSWAIRRAWQTIQWWVREAATAKNGQNSTCRSSLQAQLSAERERFICPASLRANPVKDVMIHILSSAVSGAIGARVLR